jgi:Flp pilus assembly protein CpaB
MRKSWALALSLVIAVVSTVFLVVITEQQSKPEPMEPVIVFSDTVGDREPIQHDHINVVHYPVRLIPEGAISDPDQVVGKYPRFPTEPGQLVLDSSLREERLKEGTRNGMVKVGVPIDLISSSGVLKVGDVVHVAVASSREPGMQEPTQSRILYRNLRVMALKNQQGQDIDSLEEETLASSGTGDIIPAVATLEATPEHAKEIFLASQQGPLALFVNPWATGEVLPKEQEENK